MSRQFWPQIDICCSRYYTCVLYTLPRVWIRKHVVEYNNKSMHVCEEGHTSQSALTYDPPLPDQNTVCLHWTRTVEWRQTPVRENTDKQPSQTAKEGEKSWTAPQTQLKLDLNKVSCKQNRLDPQVCSGDINKSRNKIVCLKAENPFHFKELLQITAFTGHITAWEANHQI